MVQPNLPPLALLYVQDETAWLERMAELVAQRRFDELDHHNLSAYLNDMARRDKREVLSRLKLLLSHLLKWEFQPGHRSSSWRSTIVDQQEELSDLLESGSLRRYAEEVLSKVHQRAIQKAASETGLPEETFPEEPLKSLDEFLEQQL